MLASIQTVAQENWGIDVGYKVAINRFNHAYSIKNTDNTISHHGDGFVAHNLYVDLISWNESTLFSANMEGIFYWVAQEILTKPKPGPLKSKFFGYDDVLNDNPQIIPKEDGHSNFVNPEFGGGDYQYLDIDIAWGGRIKGGINLATGFLGSNEKANGIGGFGTSALTHNNAQTPNIGYFQYGLIGHFLIDESNVNQLASLSVSRLITASKRFDKRKGYAVELEFKYFLGEDGNDWRPYIIGFTEYRKFEAGETNVVRAASNPTQIPAFKSVSFGVKVGVLLGNLL